MSSEDKETWAPCDVCAMFQFKDKGIYEYHYKCIREELVEEKKLNLCWEHWHQALTMQDRKDRFPGVQMISWTKRDDQ